MIHNIPGMFQTRFFKLFFTVRSCILEMEKCPLGEIKRTIDEDDCILIGY